MMKRAFPVRTLKRMGPKAVPLRLNQVGSGISASEGIEIRERFSHCRKRPPPPHDVAHPGTPPDGS